MHVNMANYLGFTCQPPANIRPAYMQWRVLQQLAVIHANCWRTCHCMYVGNFPLIYMQANARQHGKSRWIYMLAAGYFIPNIHAVARTSAASGYTCQLLEDMPLHVYRQCSSNIHAS